MGSVEIIWVLHVEAGFLEEQTCDRARFSFLSFLSLSIFCFVYSSSVF